MIRFPYRWTRRTLWSNLSGGWFDITNGFRNLWRWIPIIWYDADYDWEYLAAVMEFKLRAMSKRAGDARIVMSWHDTERRCLICAELLKRLRADDYFENAQIRFGNTGMAVKHANAVSKHDKRYLGELIGKYLDYWWD